MSNKYSTNPRFTVNFFNRSIVGTKASFDKAGKGYGEIYDELMRLISAHPDYAMEVKEQKKHTAKPKKTYAGLTIPLIRDYIELQKNADDLLREFINVRDLGEARNAKYPTVKKWFCDTFKNITVDEVKKAVNDHYLAQAKSDAHKMAEKALSVEAKSVEAEASEDINEELAD